MTDREKIINIVEQNKLCIVDVDCKDCQYKDKLDKTFTCGSYKLADMLIAANIGDVTAYKAEAEYWEKICKFEGDEYHTTIKNAAEHARHLMQERDDSKIEYRGYQTYIHYSAADKVLYGKIEGIKDLVNFESHSVTEIEKEFHKAVDDYIEFCREVGKNIDEVKE